MSWGDSMEKEYIGNVVTTHGIKGELRIKSNFQFKDKVFKVGNKIIIDDKNYTIKSHRVHKDFDMVTLNDYTNINEVLFLLKKKVFFLKSDLELNDDEVLDSELLTYQVLTDDNKCGIIKEIFFGGANNKIIRVLFDREVLIPLNSPMIVKIDKKEKKIFVKLLKGI